MKPNLECTRDRNRIGDPILHRIGDPILLLHVMIDFWTGSMVRVLSFRE